MLRNLEMSYIWTRFPLWIFFVVVLLQPLLAQEISCDDSGLAPETNTLGYKIREGSIRCEGLYRSPVGSSLEIVGFRYGNSSLSSERSILNVSAPPLKQLAINVLNIRAEAIPLDTYYRLDAVITEDQPLTWPLNEVVIPAGISPDELGIFGWIQKDTGKVLVPVDVYPAGLISPAKVGKKPLTVIVRPAINVDKILWRTFPENSIQRPEWNELERDKYPNGRYLTFVVPDGPTEIIGLELVAKLHKQPGWEDPLEFRIYRVGK